MKSINLAAAQFQPKDGDKEYNLSVIESLVVKSRELGAEVISFHELSITAYTFLQGLDYHQIEALAEEVPKGASCKKLVSLASKYKSIILAGLLEKDQGKLYNTYVCVDQ